MGDLVAVADAVGRTGDTSLYTFQSPGGLFGSNGVSLLNIVRLSARLTNKTVQYYATDQSSQQTPEFLLTWDANGPYGASHSYMQQIIALANRAATPVPV